uniref:Zinc transporter 9 n=1 Tax=Romanomermis culicivorax TaxID=13658 RepID=A0A915IPZ3_ROMCU
MGRIRNIKLLCTYKNLAYFCYFDVRHHCVKTTSKLKNSQHLSGNIVSLFRSCKSSCKLFPNDYIFIAKFSSSSSAGSPTTGSKGPTKNPTSKEKQTVSTESTPKMDNSKVSIGDGIKGSEFLSQKPGVAKPEAPKRVIKVVPTTSKISEMSGGDSLDATKSSKLITALRAMNEYCLTERHLESLPRFERRSAYFGELPTIMYTEADVERLAIQIVLAIGIHQSIKKPDPVHPYGYSNLRHVTSLISGVGIFFLGTGLSVYHGIHGLMVPHAIEPMFWSFVLLGASFLSEGATLLFAYDEIRKKALAHHMPVKEFIWDSHEPSLNVVLLEDCASVLGVSIAAISLALSQILNSHVPDAIGSIAIGGLLGVVASFIIYTNSAHLVGKSMPQDEIIEIVRELELDPLVRSVQDVKTTELGGEQTRFKAEVDLNGFHMTKAYLKTQDLPKLFEEVKNFDKAEDLEKFMQFHGEQIVDRVGAEIDRIEQNLKNKHPDLRHVDLEVL